jgi:hypothetical protein
MPRKQRYGGLSPRYVRLIRNYLRELTDLYRRGEHAPETYFLWCGLVTFSKELDNWTRPNQLMRSNQQGAISQSTFNALKAGLKVLIRKRIGRICDWNPHQSFAALGITEGTSSRPSTSAPSNSDQQANAPELEHWCAFRDLGRSKLGNRK